MSWEKAVVLYHPSAIMDSNLCVRLPNHGPECLWLCPAIVDSEQPSRLDVLPKSRSKRQIKSHDA
ncbi:MAG: hypothetical protein KJ017_01265 [Alphaproteobacteria bacterium]|nr:hypothetical protein [Alphaproteobacteria bacterium]